MPRRNELSVVRAPSGEWELKGRGMPRSSTYDTQAEAVDAARKLVQRSGGGDVIVHGRDGKIRSRDTIGDPARVRERRRTSSARAVAQPPAGHRTTLTVPADVLELAGQYMRTHGVTLQQALLQLARTGAREERRRAEALRLAERRRRAVAARARGGASGPWPSHDEVSSAILSDHDV